MELYEYIKKFKVLIARERNAEIEFHKEEIKSLTVFKREKKGRAFSGMVRDVNPRLEHDSIFRFKKENNDKLPHNEFTVGSNVLVSTGLNSVDNSLSGIVHFVTPIFIEIYFPKQANILFKKNLRIDLYVNETTYNTQNKVLDSVKDWNFERANLREIILHKQKPRLGDEVELSFYDYTLNPSQKLAVSYALREKDFYLIQGPPGTGKTKTSIEIIRQQIKQGKKVLVSADSNMAVDNIMLGLLDFIDVIRLGESPKILPKIQEHTFSRVIEKDIRFEFVRQGLEKLKRLKNKQRDYLIPNRKNSKGLSHFQIRKMAEREQSDFGITLKNIESMAKWIILQSEIQPLQIKVGKIKKEIIEKIVNSASVICTTNTNCAHDYLASIKFDLVLIDEAGQSTEPSCLIPISKAGKVIMVGDHKQLPPTILSQDAKDLSVSLFERMFNKTRFTLLDTQYRMHPLINEFSSKMFYDGKIKDAQGNETKKLEKDAFSKNVVFIECFGKEEKHKGQTSYYNNEEVEMVFNLVLKYSKLGFKKEDMGVISPYKGQVNKLKDRLPFIEVNSIDGFQGREKKIIIISLVRSNDKESIGFLKDLRRLNVALTRAISELVVIGNPKTISCEDTYAKFIKFVKEKGCYVSEGNLGF
jgi:predicted DNA helicase